MGRGRTGAGVGRLVGVSGWVRGKATHHDVCGSV